MIWWYKCLYSKINVLTSIISNSYTIDGTTYNIYNFGTVVANKWKSLCLGIYMAIFWVCSSFCTERSLLVELGEHMAYKEWNWVSHVQGNHLYYTVSLVSLSFNNESSVLIEMATVSKIITLNVFIKWASILLLFKIINFDL